MLDFFFLFFEDYWRLSNNELVHYRHQLVWGVDQNFNYLHYSKWPLDCLPSFTLTVTLPSVDEE